MGLLSFLMLLGFYRYILRPDVTQFGSSKAAEYIHQQAVSATPLSIEERIAAGVFLVVVALWVLPSRLSGILLGVSAYLDQLGAAIPPLAGAALLCIITVKNRPVLGFSQWMREGVEWDTIALVATVQVLAAAIQNRATGINEFLV